MKDTIHTLYLIGLICVYYVSGILFLNHVKLLLHKCVGL